MAVRTLDPKMISTLLGAGLGASTLEGDGDIFGATIGLGIGAAIGANFKPIMPNTQKFISRDYEIQVKPGVSDLDETKADMMEKLRNAERASSTGNLNYEFLENSYSPYDKENPYKTLTNKNIKDAVANSSSLADLKRIESIVNNKNGLNTVSMKSLGVAERFKGDAITRVTAKETREDKLAVLRKYFQDLGYDNKELEEKMNLFSERVTSSNSMQIERGTGKLNIDGIDFKVSSSFEGKGGISTFSNSHNMYSVSKINPFAAMYSKDMDGNAIAKAIGISFADAAKKDEIIQQIERYSREGAKPEDLKALLLGSGISESEIEGLIAPGYRHLEYESGFRASGLSQETIEKDHATNLSRRVSDQMIAEKVFNIDEDTGMVSEKGSFKTLSAFSYNKDTGSDLQVFENKLSKELGIPNLKHGVKSDDTHTFNTKGENNLFNTLSPSERNQSTTGSRTNPLDINPNSVNRTTRAMKTLYEKGMVPDEYSTSLGASRVTVDAKAFNTVSSFYNGKPNLSLGDGSSLGDAETLNDFTHKAFKNYSIYGEDSKGVTLSSELTSILQTRNKYSITGDTPTISTEGLEGYNIYRAEHIEGALEHRESIKFQAVAKGSPLVGVNPLAPPAGVKAVDKRVGNLKRWTEESIRASYAEFGEGKSIVEKRLQARILKTRDSSERQSLIELRNLVMTTDKEGLEAFTQYSKTVNKVFEAGEVLGVNPNGSEVKMSEEFTGAKLSSANITRKSPNDPLMLNFLFESTSSVGEGDYRKNFGTSGKENVKNIKREDFLKSLAVANYLNNTGYTPEVNAAKELTFNTNIKDADGKDIYKTFQDSVGDIDAEFNRLKGMTETATIITDTSGAGQKVSSAVYDALEAGEYNKLRELGLSDNLSQKITDIHMESSKTIEATGHLDAEAKINARKSESWALSQLVNSVTEGKASTESVMGLSVLGLKNVRKMTDNYFTGSDKQKLSAKRDLEYLLGDKILTSSSDVDIVKANVEREFLLKVDETQKLYGSDRIFRAGSDDTFFKKETVDLFRAAYGTPKESLHIASPDISPHMRTGSGGTGKTMSHTAQMQLRMNGYSIEDLQLFGEHSKKELYDLKFVAQLSEEIEYDRTINSFLDSKDVRYQTYFLDEIKSLDPTLIDDFLIKEGVSEKVRGEEFLYYSMRNKNKEDLITVPIYKRDSDKISDFQIESGKNTRKPLKNMIFGVINEDLRLAAKLESNPDLYAKATENFKTNILNTFFNPSNPQMKSALALTVPNSSYSVAMHASGIQFDDIVEKYAAKGESIVGITEQKAVDILRRQGVEGVTLENFRSEYLSSEGLMLTELDDGSKVQHIALQNREPAASGNSVRSVGFYIFSADEIGTDSLNTVYMSDKDLHYSKLMYGDFDLDHTLLYNFKGKVSREEYDRIEAIGKEVAIKRSELIELSDGLGVKGSDKSIYSLDLAIQEGDEFLATKNIQRGTPEYNQFIQSPESDEYFEFIQKQQEQRLSTASRKGSYRKIVSPAVTQLSTSLAENIQQLTHFNGAPITGFDKHVMRTLGHSLVENLLKTQHISTSDLQGIKQLPVEELISKRNNAARNKTVSNKADYKEHLKKNIVAMFPEEDPKELLKTYSGHIDALVEAETNNLKNPIGNASNTMDLPKNRSFLTNEGSFKDLSSTITDVASVRTTTQLPLIDLASKDVNIERSLKLGYNELLDNARNNISANKIPLLVGGGALALGALLTQKDPNFKPKNSARADVNSMQLAPSVISQEQSKNSDPMLLDKLGKSVNDYVLPEVSLQDVRRQARQAVNIQGRYNSFGADVNNSMKEAIFGESISNVRIESTYV